MLVVNDWRLDLIGVAVVATVLALNWRHDAKCLKLVQKPKQEMDSDSSGCDFILSNLHPNFRFGSQTDRRECWIAIANL